MGLLGTGEGKAKESERESNLEARPHISETEDIGLLVVLVDLLVIAEVEGGCGRWGGEGGRSRLLSWSWNANSFFFFGMRGGDRAGSVVVVGWSWW